MVGTYLDFAVTNPRWYRIMSAEAKDAPGVLRMVEARFRQIVES
jgi:hypothetical protein